MTTLTDDQRVKIWAGYIEELIGREATGVYAMRDDIKAAVDAADGWTDDNQASYNAALPEPFKSWATPRLKALLLFHVVLERFNQDVS